MNGVERALAFDLMDGRGLTLEEGSSWAGKLQDLILGDGGW